jgi:hypothetical protein
MRTFSEKEAREVFAQAARAQQSDDDATDATAGGLSLDELQEIGLAAGLDPAFVAAAAASLGADAPRPATRLGVPLEVRRTRTLPGPMTDELWEQIVATLRAQTGGPGTASQVGRIREWTGDTQMGASGAYGMHLAVRPTLDGGTEVVVEQRGMRENALGLALTAGMFGLTSLLFVLLAAIKGSAPLGWTAFVFLALALLTGAGTRMGMALWARRTGARFDALLDRVDLLARDAVPSAVAAMPSSRLDFDAINEPEGETARRRVRS